ncbi:caspase family protein [Sorangium sp. So ce726]|uniref:caspase family protein n=1 Tax=Sorangium sp. So ce726 TaxID=3133319 RepID=UPI003F62F9C5
MASKRALLTAINNYGNEENNLPSCLEDAAKFRSLLSERYGFSDFKELYDGDATVANVEAGLAWLFENVGPDDRLVFFYSGHGFQQPRGENLEECLVLGDMQFLFDNRLSELSQTAPPGVLTVVLDSCFSGGMQKQVAIGGRVELARSKAWSPPPDAQHEQKSLIGRPLVPRPFGSVQIASDAGVKRLVLGREATAAGKAAAPGDGGGDETDQLTFNGLLLSACSENETAAASTSATEGLSAFSFSLQQVLGAAGDEPSIAEVHEGVRAKLQEMGFRQTPLLKVPAEPAGLAESSFLTLAPAAAAPAEAQGQPATPAEAQGQPATPAAAQGQPAKGAAKSAQPTRATAGSAAPSSPPNARPAAGGAATSPTTPAEGQPRQPQAEAAPAGATAARPATQQQRPAEAAPAGTTARPATPPAAAAGGPQRQQGATSQATGAAAAAPVNTDRREQEGASMDTMQMSEEKWIGLAASVTASLVPEVIRAVRRKDFAPEAGAANGVYAGNGDIAAEEKWVAALARVAVPAAISAVPGMINAIRGKDASFEQASPAASRLPYGSAEGGGWQPQQRPAGAAPAGVAAPRPAMPPAAAAGGQQRQQGVTSQATGAGAPQANTGMRAQAGAPTDTLQVSEEKWIGLAASVTASLVPEVIRAVRRKDFAPEAPATDGGYNTGDGDPAGAEEKWVAAFARAVVPAAISAMPGMISAIRGKDASFEQAAPAASRLPAGGAEGEEKWLPLAIGIATSVVPEVIRAVRRKDFAPEAGAASGVYAGNGDTADAEEKWVAALARAAVPAAISAVPGMISAIRGKDASFELAPPAASRLPVGGAEGEEKWLPLAIGIATSVVPEVIRAVRRKDFALGLGAAA